MTTRRIWAFTLAALIAAFALAVCVSPFASSAPDGLEKTATDAGFLGGTDKGLQPLVWAPLHGYAFPGIRNPAIATAVAGLAGVGAAFVLAYLLARLVKRGQSQ